MDPFEVRLAFLNLLTRQLNATQQSIQRAVSYAVKNFAACGEDIWECILEECEKGTMGQRINILYFLDGLCERCLLIKAQQKQRSNTGRVERQTYVDFVTKDLTKIIEGVVPEERQGRANLIAAKQILDSWRSRRVIDPHRIDEALAILEKRPDTISDTPQMSAPSSPPHMSKNEVLRRIEEDRERHKRLRERRWVQPISYASSSYNPNNMPLASFLPLTADDDAALDIEFENEWEATSDWNDDDDDVVDEETNLCYPPEDDSRMDIS